MPVIEAFTFRYVKVNQTNQRTNSRDVYELQEEQLLCIRYLYLPHEVKFEGLAFAKSE